MFIKRLECVAIWSEDYKKLGEWYKDTLELTSDLEMDLPDDTGMGFTINGVLLWIGQHSEVKGKSKDPNRIMLEFWVNSVEKVHKKFVSKNVKLIRAPFLAPNKEFYVLTAQDPENNTIQFLSKEK